MRYDEPLLHILGGGLPCERASVSPQYITTAPLLLWHLAVFGRNKTLQEQIEVLHSRTMIEPEDILGCLRELFMLGALAPVREGQAPVALEVTRIGARLGAGMN